MFHEFLAFGATPTAAYNLMTYAVKQLHPSCGYEPLLVTLHPEVTVRSRHSQSCHCCRDREVDCVVTVIRRVQAMLAKNPARCFVGTARQASTSDDT
jgi:hypothetical protein